MKTHYILIGIGLFFLLAACDESETQNINELEELESSCSSYINTTQANSNFSLELEGTQITPQNGQFHTQFIDNNLHIRAFNSDYSVSVTIPNPSQALYKNDGVDQLEFSGEVTDLKNSTSSQIDCGVFKVTLFDLTNQTLSGLFHFTTTSVNNLPSIAISNGILNDVFITTSNFCKMDFEVDTSVKNIQLNDTWWKFSAAYDSSGEIIASPLCTSWSGGVSISFSESDEHMNIFGIKNVKTLGYNIDGGTIDFADNHLTHFVNETSAETELKNLIIGNLKGNSYSYTINHNELTLSRIDDGVVFKFFMSE